MTDWIDGEHYRSLRRTKVQLWNSVTKLREEQSYNHFAGCDDIALALSTDGAKLFKRGRADCWPLMLVNLNLPPEQRYQKSRVMSCGVIHGPGSPVEIDTFLEPLVADLVKLGRGIEIERQGLVIEKTLMRAFVLYVFGDMPAVAKPMQMKGHNAVYACRACKIKGLRAHNQQYCPLNGPVDAPDDLEGDIARVYDPLDLPMRTDQKHREDAALADEAEKVNSAIYERATKATGVKGTPVLARLSAIRLRWQHLMLHWFLQM